MAPEASPDQDPLAPLVALSSGRPASVDYFRAQLRAEDEYIRVGALITLIDQARDLAQLPEVADSLRYGSVRARLLSRAMGVPKSWLEGIASGAGASPDQIKQRRMLAELAFDDAGLEAASGEMYLATGVLDCLLEAAHHAEVRGGWRAAVPWAVRAVVIAPMETRGHVRLHLLLSHAGQTDLLARVADILGRAGIHPAIEIVCRAAVAQARGQHDECLALLAPLLNAPRDNAIAAMIGEMHQLCAVSEEKRRDYAAAYARYKSLNESARNAAFDPKSVYRMAEARDRLVVPALRADGRSDIVQMLGFPRSGTTLLENVLATHTDIETFEEIPALQAAYATIEAAIAELGPGISIDENVYVRAREKYFEELDLRRLKTGAGILIDKMPLRTVESNFLRKLFPQWRYIFSIRHPFDVVLSCFKQQFRPNVAMENFRTIEDTARLYDFAMSQWFAHFSMDSKQVCYVRYEELVLDFETTVRRVLDFLGVEWTDELVDFASAAENRAARTPSYQKVRQGLGIGVQTSWRNYRFVFDTEAADPLRKWVDFFGYEAT